MAREYVKCVFEQEKREKCQKYVEVPPHLQASHIAKCQRFDTSCVPSTAQDCRKRLRKLRSRIRACRSNGVQTSGIQYKMRGSLRLDSNFLLLWGSIWLTCKSIVCLSSSFSVTSFLWVSYSLSPNPTNQQHILMRKREACKPDDQPTFCPWADVDVGPLQRLASFHTF